MPSRFWRPSPSSVKRTLPPTVPDGGARDECPVPGTDTARGRGRFRQSLPRIKILSNPFPVLLSRLKDTLQRTGAPD